MLKHQTMGLCKALSILLAIVLIVAMLSFTARAATTPAFEVNYPKLDVQQADGSKKIKVLVKGSLPSGAAKMDLGYVLLAEGDAAPTAAQIKSLYINSYIPGATVITWGQQLISDSETPITLTGAQHDTNYDFYAVFWNNDEFSEVRHLDVKTPAAGAVDPGTSMLASPTGVQWEEDTVTAKWNAVEYATSYSVTLWKDGQSSMMQSYPSITGTECTFGIYSPGNYYFTVQAIASGYTSSLKPASAIYHQAAPLSGTATISNVSPKIGDTLNGSLVGGNNTGMLSYSWKAGGSPVGANAASYTVVVADLGKTITLEITSSEETGIRRSEATMAVAPADDVETKTYNISAAADNGGKITPGGTIYIEENDDLIFAITPSAGYKISDVMVDGTSVGAVTSYTFSSVTANHTIKAVFAHDCPSKNFTDVDTNLWYHEGIDFALLNGLFNGTSATTFEPEAKMTRAMLVTVLWRLDNKPPATASNLFADVAEGEWYTEAVAWAAENNIVNGYDASTFGPHNPITREQMAAIMYRYAGYKGYNLTATTDISGYTDAVNVQSWAQTAIKWAVAEKLINGVSATSLSPEGNATRAQVATILMRYVNNIVE